jgi:hypothetical protein
LPHYFFHLREDNPDALDEEGMVLPDDRKAMAMGRLAARDLAAESVKEGQSIGRQYIEIVDHDGRAVGTVALREVVILVSPPIDRPI